MARKSHRKDRRPARRVPFAGRYRWLAVLAARTAATVVLMIVARLLHVPDCGA